MESEYAEIGRMIDEATSFAEICAVEERLSAYIARHPSPDAAPHLALAQEALDWMGHRMARDN